LTTGKQVLQELPTNTSVDRPFSFRHHLADQRFDLHNPEPDLSTDEVLLTGSGLTPISTSPAPPSST
jgi:hypothetical protein